MSRQYTDKEIADAGDYFKYLVQKHDDEDRAAGLDPAVHVEPEREKAPASKLVNLADARARKLEESPKPAPKADNDQSPNHVRLGKAVVEIIQARSPRQDLMFTEKAAYRYHDGLWSMATDGLTFWLNMELEHGAKAMGMTSNAKLISEARSWIQRQKKLCREHAEIAWDAHGLVPTKSGLVDPRTGECRPMRPDDYCTWRIETEYDPIAVCPWWLQMLEDVFADRSAEERADTIGVIQELLGVGLIDDKPRELSRALIFQGGSNFGKSGLLEVLSGLFGTDFNSTSIEALEGTHGMMAFVKNGTSAIVSKQSSPASRYR